MFEPLKFPKVETPVVVEHSPIEQICLATDFIRAEQWRDKFDFVIITARDRFLVPKYLYQRTITDDKIFVWTSPIDVRRGFKWEALFINMNGLTYYHNINKKFKRKEKVKCHSETWLNNTT